MIGKALQRQPRQPFGVAEELGAPLPDRHGGELVEQVAGGDRLRFAGAGERVFEEPATPATGSGARLEGVAPA
jgi:hypothetical protein